MTIEKITTHVVNADDRTLSQYDDSPRLKALIQFFAEQHQDLEDVLYAVLVNMTIDTATGDMLEKYGIIIGWPRVDVIDDDTESYRSFLDTAIQVNVSDARAVTVLNIFNTYLTSLYPGVTQIGDPAGPDLVTDGDMEAGLGSDVYVDGDMEAVGVAAWTTTGLLTKETTPSPHGGSQVLRIEHNGTADPYARQTVLEVGKSYNISGWARAEDLADWSYPRVNHNGVNLWVGTRSATWQAFDVDFVATATTIDLVADNFALGYSSDFDDVTIKETCPDWTADAVGIPLATKSTADPYAGSQAIRLAYSAANNPFVYQAIMTPGSNYEVTGWARGDGGDGVPRITDGGSNVWTGTSSTSWQEVSLTVTSASTANLCLYNVVSAPSSGWVEFDDITCAVPETLESTPNTTVEYKLNAPASFEIQWFSDYLPSQLEINRINDILTRVTPLGVGSTMTQGKYGAFILDSDTRGLDNGRLGRRIDVL